MRSLLIIVAEAVPAGALMAAAMYERWRRKRSGERSPGTEKLLREAGHSLRIKLEDQQDRFDMWFAIAVVGGVFCGFTLAFDIPGAIGGCAAGACAAAVGTVMAWRLLLEMRTTRLGLKGEQATAEKLQGLAAAGYRIFHDLPGAEPGSDGKKWNIDHVAVGPAGVFAIETKTRTKKPGRNARNDHTVEFDGKRLIFPSGINADAAAQARRNADWLGREMSRATGERVTARPILVIPGWWINLRANSDLKVLSPKQVPELISGSPNMLTAAAIERIAYQLEQRCRDVEF